MEYEFTAENFEEEVVQSSVPVLVDFFATWCGPCRMMAPAVEELAKELDGKVKVGKLDVDKNAELTLRYQVMAVPTFILFKDGKVEATIKGAVGKEELQKEIDRVLA